MGSLQWHWFYSGLVRADGIDIDTDTWPSLNGASMIFFLPQPECWQVISSRSQCLYFSSSLSSLAWASSSSSSSAAILCWYLDESRPDKQRRQSSSEFITSWGQAKPRCSGIVREVVSLLLILSKYSWSKYSWSKYICIWSAMLQKWDNCDLFTSLNKHFKHWRQKRLNLISQWLTNFQVVRNQ